MFNQPYVTPYDPRNAELNNRLGGYGLRLLGLYHSYKEIHPTATEDDFINNLKDVLDYSLKTKAEVDKEWAEKEAMSRYQQYQQPAYNQYQPQGGVTPCGNTVDENNGGKVKMGK